MALAFRCFSVHCSPASSSDSRSTLTHFLLACFFFLYRVKLGPFGLCKFTQGLLHMLEARRGRKEKRRRITKKARRNKRTKNTKYNGVLQFCAWVNLLCNVSDSERLHINCNAQRVKTTITLLSDSRHCNPPSATGSHGATIQMFYFS